MADLRDFTYETDETPATRVLIRADLAATQFQTSDGNGNFPPNPAPTLRIFARSGASRSGNGIHARGIVVRFTSGPPEGYSDEAKLFIPVFRLPTYRILKVGETGTYLGEPVIIISKRPEVMRS